MSVRETKLPGPDHPIEIEPSGERVVIRVGDHVVADSSDALLLTEAGHDPVLYLPMSDVDEAVLRPSETTTWCPYKGEASYKSIDVGDGVVEDALWYYPDAHEGVGEITGYAAFYPDKVTTDRE